MNHKQKKTYFERGKYTDSDGAENESGTCVITKGEEPFGFLSRKLVIFIHGDADRGSDSISAYNPEQKWRNSCFSK